MALFNELPVYQKCNELLVAFSKTLPQMNRIYRMVYGEKIAHDIIEVMASLFKANRDRRLKSQYIMMAREEFVKVVVGMRLMFELRAINRKTFVALSVIAEEVSKQLATWYEQSKNIGARAD